MKSYNALTKRPSKNGVWERDFDTRRELIRAMVSACTIENARSPTVLFERGGEMPVNTSHASFFSEV